MNLNITNLNLTMVVNNTLCIRTTGSGCAKFGFISWRWSKISKIRYKPERIHFGFFYIYHKIKIFMEKKIEGFENYTIDEYGNIRNIKSKSWESVDLFFEDLMKYWKSSRSPIGRGNRLKPCTGIGSNPMGSTKRPSGVNGSHADLRSQWIKFRESSSLSLVTIESRNDKYRFEAWVPCVTTCGTWSQIAMADFLKYCYPPGHFVVSLGGSR